MGASGLPGRLRFDPNMNYRSVVQQQGRVTLDSDTSPILEVDLGMGPVRFLPLGKSSGTRQITITRQVNPSSPSIFLNCSQAFPAVTIRVGLEDGRRYIVNLTDARVAHVLRLPKPGINVACEAVKFSCREMEVVLDLGR